jgi:MinD-like ATPase involved in chromosome partitioning or flagellar assembly
MGVDQALADEYEVLLIDDVCSFLTPRLVRSLRDLGREIVGVYNPADAPDAKRHLLECGITDVVESDAPADEFLSVATATLMHRRPALVAVPKTPKSFRVGVLGPLGGVGATEVAIGLASGLSESRSTLLIDLDQQNPSVAQRLDLSLHPNLMTAVDSAHHSGNLDEAIIDYERMGIVGGLANPGGQELPPVEIDGLLDELGATGFEVLVADLGVLRSDRVDMLRFNVLIAVGLASPVGMSRLIRAVQALVSRGDRVDTVAVVNRVGASGRNRLEIKSEIARLMPDIPVVLLPEDRGLERAAWDGTRLARGPFARSIGHIAALIDQATP